MLSYHFEITDKQTGKKYLAHSDGSDFDEAYTNLLEVYCHELDCWEDDLIIEFLHNGLPDQD
jgi:hypothetical protein